MKQKVLLQTLKQKNTELTNKFGVKSLLLFGSVARVEGLLREEVQMFHALSDKPILQKGQPTSGWLLVYALTKFI